MEQILIRPKLLRQFGSAEGIVFCLVTNSNLLNEFQIAESDSYVSNIIVPYDEGHSFEYLLDKAIPEPAHVLVISPHCFFRSPEPEKIGRRKLVVMPCHSTPTPLSVIAYFLGIMERSDFHEMESFAERFFKLGQASERLEIVDERYGTRAIFNHLDDSYEWNLQAGFLEWGEQQIAPAGELSVLPDDIMQFSAGRRLAVSGEIALQGQPTVHSGAVSFLSEDQTRIYKGLECMHNYALITTVEDGIIRELRATHTEAEPAADMLNAMFMLDSHYRIIWEIGFGINTAHKLLPGNFGMNETYGGANGVFHLGLGLTPYTQYALIIICPAIRVLGRNGKVLVG